MVQYEFWKIKRKAACVPGIMGALNGVSIATVFSSRSRGLFCGGPPGHGLPAVCCVKGGEVVCSHLSF